MFTSEGKTLLSCLQQNVQAGDPVYTDLSGSFSCRPGNTFYVLPATGPYIFKAPTFLEILLCWPLLRWISTKILNFSSVWWYDPP